MGSISVHGSSSSHGHRTESRSSYYAASMSGDAKKRWQQENQLNEEFNAYGSHQGSASSLEANQDIVKFILEEQQMSACALAERDCLLELLRAIVGTQDLRLYWVPWTRPRSRKTASRGGNDSEDLYGYGGGEGNGPASDAAEDGGLHTYRVHLQLSTALQPGQFVQVLKTSQSWLVAVPSWMQPLVHWGTSAPPVPAAGELGERASKWETA